METDNSVIVSSRSAAKALELVYSVKDPTRFAKLLDDNLRSETITPNGGIREFFQDPHIMVSRYDANTLFFDDGARDEMQLYIKSMVKFNFRATLGFSRTSYRTWGAFFGGGVSSHRVRTFLLPALLLTKLAFRFDIWHRKEHESDPPVSTHSNTIIRDIFEGQLFALEEKSFLSSTSKTSGIPHSYLVML